MRRAIPLLFVALLTCAAVTTVLAHERQAKDNISGHYVLRYSNVRGSLNVQLLPNSRIKFSLVALLETGGGSTRNGVVEGTVELKNGMAVYTEGECRITLKFVGSRVIVTESNVEDCGFGAFVTAKGTYIRKSRKPTFDS